MTKMLLIGRYYQIFVKTLQYCCYVRDFISNVILSRGSFVKRRYLPIMQLIPYLFSVHQSRQFQTQRATMRDHIIAFLLVFLTPACSFCCACVVGQVAARHCLCWYQHNALLCTAFKLLFTNCQRNLYQCELQMYFLYKLYRSWCIVMRMVIISANSEPNHLTGNQTSSNCFNSQKNIDEQALFILTGCQCNR